MKKLSYFGNRKWTRVEFSIWLFTSAFMIIAGGLAVSGVIDSWALIVGNLLVIATSVMLYRSERANKAAGRDDPTQ